MEIVLNEFGLAILLGLVAFVTFWVMNFFNYSLTPKSYDEALAEVTRKNEQKKPKGGKKSGHKTSTHSDQESESEPRKRKMSQTMKMKRTESLKSEHVMFADEINPDEDEKFSPTLATEDLEGILQNKEEVPNVNMSLETSDVQLNTFEETHPLDDLQLVRRKSMQMTPSGSRTNSNRGSRTDIAQVGLADEVESQQIGEAKERVLKFVEPDHEGDQGMSVNKICKILRKMELSECETTSIIELMLKKEENSEWQNSNSKSNNNILSKLKKENEEKEQQIQESQELVTSLQSKLKQLRNEFNEEKNHLIREKVELNEKLKGKGIEEDSLLKREVERLKVRLDKNSDLQTLQKRLQGEEEENKKLNDSITELQKVIEAALKKIYPDIDKDLCSEHEQLLEAFVSKMRKNSE